MGRLPSSPIICRSITEPPMSRCSPVACSRLRTPRPQVSGLGSQRKIAPLPGNTCTCLVDSSTLTAQPNSPHIRNMHCAQGISSSFPGVCQSENCKQDGHISLGLPANGASLLKYTVNMILRSRPRYRPTELPASASYIVLEYTNEEYTAR